MNTILSVRLPNDIFEQLSEIAEETKRPKSFHIQKALQVYLAELADLQVAHGRLQDTNDPIISFNDLRNDFEL